MSLLKKKLEVLRRLAVEKDGRNNFDKYDYIRVDDILQDLKTTLGQVGLVLSMRAGQIETAPYTSAKGKPAWQVTVRCVYTLTDPETGEKESCPVWGQAHDTGDKALYKAYAGAFKYWAIQNFAIAGDAMDPEGPNDIQGQTKSATKATKPRKTTKTQKTTNPTPEPADGMPEAQSHIRKIKRTIAARVRGLGVPADIEVSEMIAMAKRLAHYFGVPAVEDIPPDEAGHAIETVNEGTVDPRDPDPDPGPDPGLPAAPPKSGSADARLDRKQVQELLETAKKHLGQMLGMGPKDIDLLRLVTRAVEDMLKSYSFQGAKALDELPVEQFQDAKAYLENLSAKWAEQNLKGVRG